MSCMGKSSKIDYFSLLGTPFWLNISLALWSGPQGFHHRAPGFRILRGHQQRHLDPAGHLMVPLMTKDAATRL